MDLYLARSDDGGRTFAPPVRVNDQPGEVWGFATSKPRIGVAPDGTLHVLWPANATGKAGKAILEMHYSRSTDDGRSFEAARRLNTSVDADASAFMHGGFAVAHAFQGLAVARDGSVHALWIDTRNLKTPKDHGEIFAATSTDGGKTFGPDHKVFGDVCPCCQLTTAVANDGSVYLGSRHVDTGNVRDASVSRSGDGGRSFAERVAVPGPRWQLDGCPLKPTAIATDGAHVYTAVFNGAGQPAGVYFAASHDQAKTFEAPIALHPEAAVSDSPTIAVDAAGKVHVVWHAKVGEQRRLFTRSSEDHGRSFGPVRELATPPGQASSPVATTTRDGRVLVTWQQGEQVMLDVVQ
jgi:hypothetical protein